MRLPQTDRSYRWPVLGSIALHLVVIGFFVGREISRRASEWQDSRSPGAPGRAGGGGGRTFRIELPAYHAPEQPPAPVEPPPVPQVAYKPPPIKIQKLEAPTQTGTVTSSVDVSGLTGRGPGTGGGVGSGIGPGMGVDSGSGAGGQGGDVFPPKARYTILPPLPVPGPLRGHSFRVHFWVNVEGRATNVRVDPEIKDAAYRQQFLALLREYTFEPARKLDGTRVEGETTITITL